MAKKKSAQAQTTEQNPQTIVQEKSERDQLYEELTAADEEQPVYAITMEEAPVGLHDFLPDYRYRFDGANSISGDNFVSGLAKFLETNAYLAMDDSPSRAFADGFARGVAVAALYVDSLTINPP